MTAPEIIRSLMDACTTLMDQIIEAREADWEKVNDAMVAGAKYLGKEQADDRKENEKEEEK